MSSSHPTKHDPNAKFDMNRPMVRVVRAFFRRFPRLHWWVTFLPRLTIGQVQLLYARFRGLGRSLRSLDHSKLKTSDTVFIMATGSSINAYDRHRWDVIESHDSIGLNFFLLHEHVPTYYVMENQHEIHRALLAAKHEAHKDTPLILSAQLGNMAFRRFTDRMNRVALNPPHVRKRIHYSFDLLPAGNREDEMQSAYRMFDRIGLWSVKRRFKVLTKRRGSIAHLVNLAVRIGYRRIVLCGVDLNHSEYFYDARREEFESMGLPVPPNTQTGAVHDTNDPSVKEVTIKHVMLAIRDVILEPRGVELFVGDRSSDLHPELAEFPWSEGPRQDG